MSSKVFIAKARRDLAKSHLSIGLESLAFDSRDWHLVSLPINDQDNRLRHEVAVDGIRKFQTQVYRSILLAGFCCSGDSLKKIYSELGVVDLLVTEVDTRRH